MPVSVRLDKEKCRGCTNCVKNCPTEAIRVRFGLAAILKEECVDCGQCVRVCPYQAIRPAADRLDRKDGFKYTIALPPPALYAQFRNIDGADIVLSALLELGFDEVFEVAAAAEILSELTKREMAGEAFEKPVISSSCPAVIRLIRRRFQSLLPRVSVHIAPEELAAIIARERAVEKTGLKKEEIGVFFISSCPAKVTEAREPLGLDEPVIDGVLAMDEIYLKLLKVMPRTKKTSLRTAGAAGIGWAAAGGEAELLGDRVAVWCDGMENVIRLLEDVEDEKLPEIEYLELQACTEGCIGGCMAVENPFAARARLKKLKDRAGSEPGGINIEAAGGVWRARRISRGPDAILDADFGKAMEKLKRIEELKAQLPGLDCGSCGAPGCAAMAQDVVMGHADMSYCIFNVKARIKGDGAAGNEAYLPLPFRRAGKGG